MAGHLASLIPRVRSHEFQWQGCDRRAHCFLDCDRAVILRQVEDENESGRPLDESPDGARAVSADDEIPFLMLLVLPDRLDLAFRWPSGSGYG